MSSRLSRNFATTEDLKEISNGFSNFQLFDDSSLTLPSSLPVTIDGETVNDNDLVLFASLTNTNDRGLYQASINGGNIVWIKNDDFEIVDEMEVLIEKGDTYAKTIIGYEFDTDSWGILIEAVPNDVGNVSGPANSISGGVPVYDGTTGKILKTSPVTISSAGDLNNVGNINGRDIQADNTKLDNIEANATADQTDAEIKTAYENNADTNVFTDNEKTKLSNIEANATADQTDAEIKTAYENNADTNAFTDAEKTKLSNIPANASGNMTDAEIKTAYENNADTNAFTDTEKSKLANIPANASGDMTNAEIKSAYEANADTNAFTDAEKTKLSNIPSNASGDMTDAEIKTAYENNTDTNAFTDSEKTKLSNIEANATADMTNAEIKAAYEANLDTNALTDAYLSFLQTFTKSSNINTSSLPVEITGASSYLKLPSLTETQRDGLTATNGMEIYNTTSNKFQSYENGAWIDSITSGGSLTNAEIKTAYEANANTNAFTDSEQTKLSNIEANATADQTDAEIKMAYENNLDTNAFTDAEKTKLSNIEANASGDMTSAEIKSAYEANGDTNAFTDVEKTKLSNIEANATADQSDLEIKTAYENNLDTNAFTDSEKTKLSNIEANATADMTNAEIKVAYESNANTNPLADSEKSFLQTFTKASNINTSTIPVEVSGNSSYIKFPNLNQAQIDALTPSEGMTVYNTSEDKFQGYEDGAWTDLVSGGGGASGPTGITLSGLNGTTVSAYSAQNWLDILTVHKNQTNGVDNPSINQNIVGTGTSKRYVFPVEGYYTITLNTGITFNGASNDHYIGVEMKDSANINRLQSFRALGDYSGAFNSGEGFSWVDYFGPSVSGMSHLRPLVTVGVASSNAVFRSFSGVTISPHNRLSMIKM